METTKLKKFAQFARRSLIEQVSAKLKLVLAEGSAARRENAAAVKKLDEAIQSSGTEQVVERVAYIWFNRFCALRFMDMNRYTRIGVVSPAEGQFQPEILAEAKMGHIDDGMVNDKTRQQVFALLGGKAPSRDPQGEAYRLLVVAACNDWNSAMPFLFQRIDDYTELLMPDDLLSGNSILATTREAMTPDACEDVEVIGWLYQFYISEKKDEVFDGLKKNRKITPENIPAATQLFTPHWIVRYLVENSLGRLWMLNRPGSKLIDRMDYYIKPEQAETDFLRIGKPEDIKICDPACGSGHMLTYAFDLLYAIYEEEGYQPAEIPRNILTHNLYGIEIDERAGELAAFALTMKARARQRRFFRKPVQPNICVLQNIFLAPETIKSYVQEFGNELFSSDIITTLQQFEEADSFGSLIVPKANNLKAKLSALDTLQKRGGAKIGSAERLNPEEEVLIKAGNFSKITQALQQAGYLTPKYHVVIANPPYMGKKNMNSRLQSWLAAAYPISSSDFFSAFIERSLNLKLDEGFTSMITMDSWMFGDDYTDFREHVLLPNFDICCLAHLGPHAFKEIKGEVVQVAAFIFRRLTDKYKDGVYIDLTAYPSPSQKEQAFLNGSDRHHVFSRLFSELPRSVFAYFISSHTRDAFESGIPLREISEAFTGLQTGDNERFIRRWSEISINQICFSRTEKDDHELTHIKWFPYVKGSEFRKWYGNHEFVLNWQFDGTEIKSLKGAYPRNQRFYFHSGLAYNNISNKLCTRLVGTGHIFDQKNSMFFSETEEDNKFTISFLHSKVVAPFLRVVAPKDFGPGSMKLLPVISNYQELVSVRNLVNIAVRLARADWDSNEASWDFSSLPLLNPDFRQPTLKSTYQKLRARWQEMTLEMQQLEEENNRIFIEAYGLQDELTPEVPLKEITLTCNPHYRYSGNKTEEELEALLLADTLRELISYAVGCMFGRYSLDAPGLILANQGEGIADYQRIVASHQPSAVSHQSEDVQDSSADGCGLKADGFVLSHQPSAVSHQSEAVRDSSADDCGLKADGFPADGFLPDGCGLTADGFPADGCGLTADDFPADGFPADGFPADGCELTADGSPADGFPAERSASSAFPPDADNVIPMLDGNWFTDDIADRFREFLRVAFGEQHYEVNLRFIEQALGKNGKARNIRDYFLKDFYNDHVKRYKKRPIYWLFSSPKGSFNALIYLHRYRPDTVGVVLNDYLREFRTKLNSHKNQLEAISISASASRAEKTKALKDIEKVSKMIAEMEEYEREVLYPLATEQLAIDLDDGVKVNYPKFGAALKKIPGLTPKRA